MIHIDTALPTFGQSYAVFAQRRLCHLLHIVTSITGIVARRVGGNLLTQIQNF